jgi:hypothetical protein
LIWFIATAAEFEHHRDTRDMIDLPLLYVVRILVCNLRIAIFTTVIMALNGGKGGGVGREGEGGC